MLLNHGTILTIHCFHSRIKLTLHIAIKNDRYLHLVIYFKNPTISIFCNFSNHQSCHRNRQEYRDRLDPNHIAHGIGHSSQGSQR